MTGAAWNTKKKSDEELFEDLVIKKNEYYDILTTEECLIPTLEEYIKEQYRLVKNTEKQPKGMFGHWGWRIQKEKEYYKNYNIK